MLDPAVLSSDRRALATVVHNGVSSTRGTAWRAPRGGQRSRAGGRGPAHLRDGLETLSASASLQYLGTGPALASNCLPARWQTASFGFTYNWGVSVRRGKLAGSCRCSSGLPSVNDPKFPERELILFLVRPRSAQLPDLDHLVRRREYRLCVDLGLVAKVEGLAPAIKTRPILGKLLRASKVYHWPPTNAFIHREQALVASDQRPRGACQLLYSHLGLPHFQSRISGMSTPCSSMYRLCSMSLSASCCLR